jgi:hypothetical protein
VDIGHATKSTPRKWAELAVCQVSGRFVQAVKMDSGGPPSTASGRERVHNYVGPGCAVQPSPEGTPTTLPE